MTDETEKKVSEINTEVTENVESDSPPQDSQEPPFKRVLSYRQRRSGERWRAPGGRTQTPRAKRLRRYTDSLSSLDETLPTMNEDGTFEGIEQSNIIKDILAELDEMRDQMQNIRVENKRLNEKCLKLDSLSRRNNLKIWGILEEPIETKFDVKRTVMSLLKDYGININARDIGNVQRLGARRPKTTRCTLVQFLHSEDKELTQSRGKQMYLDYGVRLEDDYPPEIEDSRKDLKLIVREAAKHRNEVGERKYNAYLSTDKLILNGRQFTVETTHNLPEELKLENIATPHKNGITAFFTKNSPLSNHYPSTQKIEGLTYTSNEQYYMHQKALTFGDSTTAEEILKEHNPKFQKTMCRKFDKKDQTGWNNKREEIMQTGLKAKFEQNQHLADFLIKTGSTNILECNPSDPFWGIGMGLYNYKIWIRNSWTQTANNKLGKLLMELRTELKRD